MSFTAKDVAKLREMTGAGMMNCKKALEETNGDIDEAVSYLRKKGIANAAKKAGNIAAEGLLGAAVASDNKSAAIVEINSQTDFVAKNDDFKKFVADVAKLALDNQIDCIDKLLNTKLGAISVQEASIELTAKIGEKIDVRRVKFIQSEGRVAAYIHPVGSKVGAVIAFEDSIDEGKAADLAMHIAAAAPSPEYVSRDQISAEVIAKEKEIESGKEDLKGKPAEIVEKIVAGRVDKLLATKVLLEQAFIKNPDQKVKDYIGSSVVQGFVRFNLGEGIERKETNFADEVAAAMVSS